MHQTDLLTKALIDGRYELLSPIGGGGMGVVYRAWQVGVERAVAVKLHRPPWTADPTISAALSARFRREAAALGRLRHPGIVGVIDAGVAPEGLYLVMSLVEGPTLEARLAADGPLSPAQAATLGVQLAEALHHAHQQGVLHRDLKPANIGFDEGQALLLDFGISLLTDQPRLTAPEQTFGTPAYMAPERIRGEEADHRADLFALGVVLFEAVTGQLPFDGADVAAVQARILRGEPAPLPASVPEPLRGTILALLAGDPAARPADCGAVARRLRSEPVRRGGRGLFWGAALVAAASAVVLAVLSGPSEVPAPVLSPSVTEVVPEVAADVRVDAPPDEPPVEPPGPAPEDAAPRAAPVSVPPGALKITGEIPAQLRQGRRVLTSGQAVVSGYYEVWADFGGGWVEVASTQLRAAGDVRVRCNRVTLACAVEEL